MKKSMLKLTPVLLFLLFFTIQNLQGRNTDFELIYIPEIEIPDDLQIYTGQIAFEVIVEPDSTISNFTIIRSVARLDSLATEIITNCLVSPKIVDNVATRANVVIEIVFDNAEFSVEVDHEFFERRINLKEQLNAHIKDRRNAYHKKSQLIRNNYSPSYPILQFNRKIVSPYHYNSIFRVNNFSSLDHFTNSNLRFRTYSVFHDFYHHCGFLDFSIKPYKSPVTFTEVYLGMGSKNYKDAQLELRKSDLLETEDLSLQVGFFYNEGNLLKNAEKSNSFITDIHYSSTYGDFNFQAFSSEMEFTYLDSIGYFRESNDKPVREKIEEYSFQYSLNHILTGIKYENIEYYSPLLSKNLYRKLNQFLLGVNISSPESFDISLRWEHIFNKNDPFDTIGSNVLGTNDVFSWSFFFKKDKLYFRSFNYTGGSYKALTHNTLGMEIFDIINLNLNYNRKSKDLNNSPTGNHINEELSFNTLIELKSLKSDISIGNRSYTIDTIFLKDENFRFFENLTEIRYRLFFLEFSIQNWFLFLKNPQQGRYLPTYSNEFCPRVVFLLEHDNSIELGLNYHYTSGSNELIAASHNTYLSSFVRIGISKLFDFNFEIHNLTNSDSIYQYEMDKTNYSLRVRWFFVN